MDGNALMLSLLFGSIGLGLFVYGKKAGRLVPLGSGLALMTLPYFIPNLLIQGVVCVILTVLPWFLRNS